MFFWEIEIPEYGIRQRTGSVVRPYYSLDKCISNNSAEIVLYDKNKFKDVFEWAGKCIFDGFRPEVHLHLRDNYSLVETWKLEECHPVIEFCNPLVLKIKFKFKSYNYIPYLDPGEENSRQGLGSRLVSFVRSVFNI